MLTRKIQKTSALVALLLAMALSPCFGKSITLTRASKKASTFLRSLEFITTINADYDEQSQKLTIDFDEDFGDVIVSIENEQKFVVASFERLHIQRCPFLFSQSHREHIT